VLLQGDTLKLVYKHGSSKPTFAPGDIVVGSTGEGYLKKVVSSVSKGDTLVLLTEQACLTDALVKCDVETTLTLVPESSRLARVNVDTSFLDQNGVRQRMVLSADGPIVEPLPSGFEFEVKLANVSIAISNENGLVVSVSCDTMILTKAVDVDLGVTIKNAEIQAFRTIAHSSEQVRFKGVRIGVEQSIVNAEKQVKLTTVHLGQVTIMAGPVPIVFLFELGVYVGVGADLSASISGEILNSASLSSNTTLGARYESGSWHEVFERSITGDADFSFSPVEMSVSVQDFLKGSLDTKIYGVAGPTLYLKPFLYDEVAFPPLKLEVGAGIAAGLGFKVEILSYLLVEFNWTFADYRWAIAETTFDTTSTNRPPGIPAAPNGPTQGEVGVSYDFTASTTDPDTDQVQYQFDWGDGTQSDWSSLVPSGTPVQMTYAWSTASTYNVKARAKDEHGSTSAWSAEHQIVISGGGGNNPPNTPSTPSGPDSGQAGVTYQFADSATDPDDDSVALRFSWGDGDTSEWSSFVSSGTLVTMQYAWASAGTFDVKAQAKDEHGSASAWSTEHQIVISGGGQFPNRVVATVPVGNGLLGVTTLTNGEYVYVANSDSDNVSVIRTSDNTVVATVAVGGRPCGVAALPSGNYVYVANYNSDSVSVIRTSDNVVVATVAVGIGTSPYGVAALPSGNYVYVANDEIHTVSVIRTSDNTVIAAVPVVDAGYGVAVLPNGSYVYVTNDADASVSVIRTSNNAVVATIPVGNGPYGMVAQPNGDYVYVANHGSDNVSVIRTSSNTVVATIPVGNGPTGAAGLPNGNYVYVANGGSDNVSVIRASDNTVVATVPVGSEPYGVVVLPNGDYVYVANHGGNVSVIGY
jgi:YVTN family beta-propeller protein